MTEFLNLLLPWHETPNDQISDVFVYFIGIAFIILSGYFIMRTFRHRSVISRLEKAARESERPAQPNDRDRLNKEFSDKGKFATVWQDFEDSLITRHQENKDVVYKTDEASLFFSEERLLNQHLNLRFWNSVPALLVGMGILGTFVGLVWGLGPFSTINFEQTDAIQVAIKELLSGVSTAFVTSVWGMFTSLLFTGLEKWRIGRVSRAIANLQRALDRLFTLTTQEEIAFRQEDELTQQTQALKSFSTDLANEITSAMAEGRKEILQGLDKTPEAFSSAMAEKLGPSIANLNIAKEEIVQELRKAPEALGGAMDKKLAPGLDALNTALTDLQNNLAEWHEQSTQARQEILQELRSVPEIIGNAIVEKLEPSLKNLNAAVEELRKEKEESSTEAIQQLVEKFQTSLSGSAMAQMEALAETVGKASESLITLPEQMKSVMAGVQEQIEQTRQLLSQTSQEQAGQMQGMLDEMLKAFQNAVNTQQGRLSETTKQVNEEIGQIAADIRDLLKSTADQADMQLSQRTREMEEASAQSIQTLQTTVTELQTAITSVAAKTGEESEAMIELLRESLESAANRTDEQLAQRAAEMEKASAQSIQTLQTTVTELQTAITSVAAKTGEESEAMIELLRESLESAANRTDEQLAQRAAEVEQASTQSIQALRTAITELQRSMTLTASQTSAESEAMANRIRELVEQSADRLEKVFQTGQQSVSTLLRQQGQQINAVNDQIANSQATLEKGREMLEEMGTSLTSVRQLIETTNVLSRRLMTGATQLESAGKNLTQASDAFNEENEKYLSANRETIAELRGALTQSQQLLNEFAHRFKTIDDGLQSIFSEIENGLNSYSTTARESLNTYLSTFSEQLSSAATALAGSVEALEECVEQLTETLNHLQRRRGGR